MMIKFILVTKMFGNEMIPMVSRAKKKDKIMTNIK
jgi:hypothetical protein